MIEITLSVQLYRSKKCDAPEVNTGEYILKHDQETYSLRRADGQPIPLEGKTAVCRALVVDNGLPAQLLYDVPITQSKEFMYHRTNCWRSIASRICSGNTPGDENED